MRPVLIVAALISVAALIFGALVLNELGHFIDDVKGSD